MTRFWIIRNPEWKPDLWQVTTVEAETAWPRANGWAVREVVPLDGPLDALAGEWGSVPALLEAVSHWTAADAERTDSGTGRRATDALRRVAAAMRGGGS